MAYEGLQTETVTIRGHNGDMTEAYYARPSKPGKVPGVVVLMHIIGWDEWIIETARRFAHHGYAAIAPNLFLRFGPGSPDDVAARARPAGGASDAEVMGDTAACHGVPARAGQCHRQDRRDRLLLRRTPHLSRRLHAPEYRRGGRLLGRRRGRRRSPQLTPKRPVAPIDLTPTITAPMLGLFGNDDMNPEPRAREQDRGNAQALGKTYEFHRYDGAGHAFLNWNQPSYRAAAAVDAWPKIFAWFGKYLGGGTTGSGAR